MPYYKEKNLLFIHIPKTGGTVIQKQLKKHCSQDLYSGGPHDLLDHPYNKVSLQHQFYTTLYKNRDKLNINFDNIKIFSVIRDPYDRVISDLLFFKLIEDDFNKEQVFDVIKNNYLNRDDLDNHNVPQYKYVTDENCKLIPNIKIFNCETLNEDNKELNKFMEFGVCIKKKIRNKDYSRYLNKESISLITEFYKKDFEIFNFNFR